MILTVK